jgi:hypothetical protein
MIDEYKGYVYQAGECPETPTWEGEANSPRQAVERTAAAWFERKTRVVLLSEKLKIRVVTTRQTRTGPESESFVLTATPKVEWEVSSHG